MATYTRLQLGSSGEEVRKLQQALIDKGYSVGSAGADGKYGNDTASAVEKYQKDNGLTVDRIAGDETQGRLYGASQISSNAAGNNTTTNSSSGSTTTVKAINGVDQATADKINSQFKASDDYTKAMEYTNSLLEKLNSGKTSYTDQIKNLMSEIQNRDKFTYDVDSDMMFQQYLKSAIGDGKQAMQDTIGQAAALTGGYGSTYAVTAANQAYNDFIQDAYDNLPEYYQMALQAYQTEGEQMYNELALLNDADDQEYQRLYDAWNTNYTQAQNMYQNEYQKWADEVANAMNYASMLNAD